MNKRVLITNAVQSAVTEKVNGFNTLTDVLNLHSVIRDGKVVFSCTYVSGNIDYFVEYCNGVLTVTDIKGRSGIVIPITDDLDTVSLPRATGIKLFNEACIYKAHYLEKGDIGIDDNGYIVFEHSDKKFSVKVSAKLYSKGVACHDYVITVLTEDNQGIVLSSKENIETQDEYVWGMISLLGEIYDE